MEIAFNNGECGKLDMKPYLDFGIFSRIKDYQAFKKVNVAFETIEWESGADLDPEFVYDKCEKVPGKLGVEPFICEPSKAKNKLTN